jgi:hypothetical protein
MTDRPYETTADPWAVPTSGVTEGTSGLSAPEAGAVTTGSSSDASTTDVAKDQARSVADDAKQSTSQVAGTAKDQAQEVAAEAKTQARQLFSTVKDEMGGQASTQQQRAAQGLRSLGQELSSMASGNQQSGIATELAGQASDRVHGVADWLEQREPGDVLQELTSFARRRPGTFLAAAAALGFLGGRVTRGLAAEHSDSSGSSDTARYSSTSAPLATPTPVATTTTTTYPGGAGYDEPLTTPATTPVSTTTATGTAGTGPAVADQDTWR